MKKISPEEVNEFKSILFGKDTSPLEFSATYFYHKDIDSQYSPGTLNEIFGFEGKSIYSDREIKVLSILEDEKDSKLYCEFKWKILAFLSLQDAFDAPLMQGDDLLSLFNQWYFYYESKYILKEAILCGLNGFFGAIGPLLRLFLEFNLLQNFVFRNRDKTQSYKFLEKYYTKAINPNWSTVIKGALPNDQFSKPIKNRCLIHLKNISEKSLHPYHPNFTLIQSGSTSPEPTLKRIFFYIMIAPIIESVLWIYYINFPMLFHGVPIERKFGFNGPIGVFVDDQTTKIIKKSIDKNSYMIFYDYTKKQQGVADCLAWY